jgi:hypothetical protein
MIDGFRVAAYSIFRVEISGGGHQQVSSTRRAPLWARLDPATGEVTFYVKPSDYPRLGLQPPAA